MMCYYLNVHFQSQRVKVAQGRVQSCLVPSEDGNKFTGFIKTSINFRAAGRLLTTPEALGCT